MMTAIAIKNFKIKSAGTQRRFEKGKQRQWNSAAAPITTLAL
jgi:hypothetical protein